MRNVPWVGLFAIVAMFLIPLIPEWLFEGRRTVKHWPRCHLCAVCGAPWTDGHLCAPAAGEAANLRVRGELRRLVQPDIYPTDHLLAAPRRKDG